MSTFETLSLLSLPMFMSILLCTPCLVIVYRIYVIPHKIFVTASSPSPPSTSKKDPVSSFFFHFALS